jgi:hypothetical protein
MAMKRFPTVPAGTGLYPVIDVDGRLPAIPSDFIGARTMTVAVAGEPQRLAGSGDLTDRGLKFHQDAADANGTNGAEWAIGEDGHETFWAEPLPNNGRSGSFDLKD